MLLDSSKHTPIFRGMAEAATVLIERGARWLMVVAIVAFALSMHAGGHTHASVASMDPSDTLVGHGLHQAVSEQGATGHHHPLEQSNHTHHADCCATATDFVASCGVTLCCPCDLTGGLRSHAPTQVAFIGYLAPDGTELAEPVASRFERPPRLL